MRMLRGKRIQYLKTLQFLIIDAFSITITYSLLIAMFRLVGISASFSVVFMLLPFIILIKLILFYSFGLYHMVLSHVGFEDVAKVSLIAIFSNSLFFMIVLVSPIDVVHPISFIFITPLEVALISLPRVLTRLGIYFRYVISPNRSQNKNTLIIGAGHGGEIVLKEIYKNTTLNNFPVAFLDDDPKKIGSRFQGIQVVGPIDQVKYYIDQFEVKEVIIAIANLQLKKLQELVALINQKEVIIKRLPLMSEVSETTPHSVIDVKVEDLLNRDEINLDNHEIKRFIEGETVLVTGGGGSIGSELCRQIIKLDPKKLIVFDIYENNAYDIQQEILRMMNKLRKTFTLKVLIGSVYHKKTVEDLFKAEAPTVVFHAAAYKHVPLMEDAPKEAIRTNIIGTYNTAIVAKQYKVKKFVLISSDKAVRPTNIMGATKRYAELIIQSFNGDNTTQFAAVRFGNVLGSNGSVIPLFKNQIESGGPVTVTHPDITRYFMTIPESVGLILQSAVYANGGELFVLDMGEPVKIKDLAEKMIKLSGYKPYRDIDIEFIGLRPGEKLFEELLVDVSKNKNRTANQKIFIEMEHKNGDKIDIESLLSYYDEGSVEDVKSKLAASIQSYKAQ